MANTSDLEPSKATSNLISPVRSPEELQLKKTIKLAIMASGNGSNFEAVAKAIKEGRLNAEIKVLIYNNPSAKVRSRAENWQVPAELVNHKEYKNNGKRNNYFTLKKRNRKNASSGEISSTTVKSLSPND